jgi:hypothetical protein
MVGSKLTCPKWHFGQVEHGNKWGTFCSIFLEKAKFSYNALNNHHPPIHHLFASLVGTTNITLKRRMKIIKWKRQNKQVKGC